MVKEDMQEVGARKEVFDRSAGIHLEHGFA